MSRLRAPASRRARQGQSTTEMVLLVAVLVVALLVAAYAFLPGFSDAADALTGRSSLLLGGPTRAASGDMR